MKRVLLSLVLLAVIVFSLPPESHAQWVQASLRVDTTITSFAVSGTNLFAVSDLGGMILSTNNGTSWIAVNSGLTNSFVASLAVIDTNLFAGTFPNRDGYGGLVFRSTNSGANWTPASTGLPSSSYVYALAVSPASGGSGTNLFAGTSGGVFRSTNKGTSWTAVNTGLPTGRFLRFAINTSGEIFVAIIGGGVFKSTDNGASWINTGCPIGNGGSSLVINGSGHIFLATGSDCGGCPSGVFRSTDDGATWDSINTGSPYYSVFPVSAFAVSGTNLFAGNWYGVHLSTNDGTSWTETGLTRLTQQTVSALAVSGGNLFAGMTDGSVWRRPLSEMVTSVREIAGSELPGSFELRQNYPNPFNPSTTIRYTLPQSADVSLVVFNTLGQKVATLVQGVQETGNHEVRFDATSLASGVYLYRLQAGVFVEAKKFVLVR